MLYLFAIIALGSALGTISFRGFGLGNAGVLLVALAFGYYGYIVPKEISELGILLFVYAIGLQVGARFFRRFAQTPFMFISIGILPVIIASIIAIFLGYIYDVRPALTLGALAGAMTSTPALVSALEALGQDNQMRYSLISLGFGLAYPFGMIGIGLSIALLTSLFDKKIKSEAESLRLIELANTASLVVKHFSVENANCIGRSVKELNIRALTNANISRVTRDGRVISVLPDFQFEKGDIVTLVTPPERAPALAMIFGPEDTGIMDLGDELITKDIEISLPDVTKGSLAELRFFNSYGAIVTRITRQGVQFPPTATSRLELGDVIRVIGEPYHVEKLAAELGVNNHRMHETSMTSFLIGILLGILVGSVPIEIGHSLELKLGLAGGCFIVSLLLGFLGKVGPLRIYVPSAARNICRDLGLILFMAGAGTESGSQFTYAIESGGYAVFGIGAAASIGLMLSSLIIAYFFLKKPLLESAGYVCGVASNSLPIQQLSDRSSSDFAAVAYATVYPVSLIAKIVILQICIRMLGL